MAKVLLLTFVLSIVASLGCNYQQTGQLDEQAWMEDHVVRGNDCTSHAQCGQNAECQVGYCIRKAECREDKQCSKGEFCSFGKCEANPSMMNTPAEAPKLQPAPKNK